MNPMLINPKIDENSDVQTQLKQMRSYLFQFKEQVEMILSNVDKDNLSQSMNTDLDLIRGGIRNYEVKMEGFSSQIAQTSKMISAKLSSDDVDAEFLIQRLNDGSTYSRIKADRINVDGIFTANGSFTVDANGDLIFSGAGIDIQSNSETQDIIKLNYGSGSTSLRPQRLSLNYNGEGLDFYTGRSSSQIICRLNSTNYRLFNVNNSQNSLMIGDANFSRVYLADSTALKEIQWKSIHNAYDDDDYVLVGA